MSARFGLSNTDPSGNIAVPWWIVGGMYEFFLFLVCSAIAFPAQENYLHNVDPHTTMQHCIYNCCTSRLNAFIPIGWVPSAGNDNPYWGKDPYEDWEANIAGAQIGPNLLNGDFTYQTCVEGCEEWRFPKTKDCGTPPKLPPYEPFDPYKATKDMCDKACQKKIMERFPGPSPEADEAYKECQDDCMFENGF